MEKIKIYDIESFRNGAAVRLHTTAYEEIYIASWKEGRYTLFIEHYATSCASDEHILSDEILTCDVCLYHEEDIDVIKVKALINNLLHQYYGKCEVEYEITSEQIQKAFYYMAN